ncbi:MAG: glycosyltransferase family 4 protein [Cyanobacteria bacterium SZAS LIN-2]|nr:glycosyltransferase family 4 protein [Cyanobacteria bacterium SZAS LIN-2]
MSISERHLNTTDPAEGILAEAGADGRPVKLALVTSGLGNINRGFEISTARWYEALSRHTDIDVRLYCGGPYPSGRQLWNFPRNSAWTKPLHYIPFLSEQQRWELTYGVEQVSFWAALNFELLKFKPDVVWLKDIPLAMLLKVSRVAFGLKYKIIFANGGMLRPESYAGYDHVQQIEQQSYEEALRFGIPENKMELISNCVPIPKEPADSDRGQGRLRTRQALGLRESDWVIVCVAAWNKYHKRIDYLLDEVARLNDPNCKLLLCGAPEVDTEELQTQGSRLLGDRVQWLNVAPDKLTEILRASDVFVLPSLRESLGNAQIEAILCGLPIIVHPHDGARFIIDDEYWMTDLSQSGNLTNRLLWMRENAATNLERMKMMQVNVANRFSEEVLSGKFESMVKRVVPG